MSSSSYYDAIKRNYDATSIQDTEILNEITRIYEDIVPHGTTLGYRPLTVLLNQRRSEIQKSPINHKRVLRIMRENNLLCHAFKRKTTRYNSYVGTVGRVHNNKINRRFMSDRPLQKLGTDVTELRWGSKTQQERLYLSVVVDFATGELIGHSTSDHPNTQFVLNSVRPVLELAQRVPYVTTIHSDQGVQYQSGEYQHELKHRRIKQSMSRKSTPLDNAPTESVIHQLKVGTTLNNTYETKEELLKALDQWIYFYNNHRVRRSNNWHTPTHSRMSYIQKIA